MAALLEPPPPAGASQGGRPGGRKQLKEQGHGCFCPENLSVGKKQGCPSALACLLEVPGGSREEEPLSTPPGTGSPLGLGQRGGDLGIECVWPGLYSSHPSPSLAIRTRCGCPASLGAFKRRAAVSLFFDQFPPLHFLHLVGGKASGKAEKQWLSLRPGLSCWRGAVIVPPVQPQQLDLVGHGWPTGGRCWPWGLCAGRRFPQEAYNYSGLIFPLLCCL